MNAILSARRPKVAFAVLFGGQTRQNPTFGQGVFAQRERRLPVGPSDADRDFARGLCPDFAPTADESYDEFRCTTLSPAEYRMLMDDLAYCSAERNAIFEHAAREAEELNYWDGSRPVMASPMPTGVTRQRHVRTNAAKARRDAARKVAQ